MVSKSKKSNVEENPFLPPPFDLDQIPLVDKDYLISETRSEFKFAKLQWWFKDTFINQIDEIGSNSQVSLCMFFPKSIILPNSLSNAKRTTSLIREPYYLCLETPFSLLHPRLLIK